MVSKLLPIIVPKELKKKKENYPSLVAIRFLMKSCPAIGRVLMVLIKRDGTPKSSSRDTT
jgi:hypothetical protein